MLKKRYKILITNDDGFEAEGLIALYNRLKEIADVTVVAPTLEKSASGHSLTLTRPLRFLNIEESFYKLDDGTPADCIFLALKKIYKNSRPDLIISGINRGANMGEDITYSGTVAGAMEGVLQGIPSIAISQVLPENSNIPYNYELASQVALYLASRILSVDNPVSKRELLNINVPPLSENEYKGYKATYAGIRHYGNDAQSHINPRGLEYFWIGLPKLEWSPRDNSEYLSDFEAVDKGFVSITPITLDMTAYNRLENLKRWI